MILLDKTVSIHRLESLGGNKSGFVTFTLEQSAAIQPFGQSEIANGVGSFNKMYKIYMDVNTDIQEGDKLQDASGNIYIVESGGIEKRDDGFIADHMDLTVKKVNG